jgi:hypothetical protein
MRTLFRGLLVAFFAVVIPGLFTATACLCYPLPFIRALCEPKLCTIPGSIVVLPILYTFLCIIIHEPISRRQKTAENTVTLPTNPNPSINVA